MPRLRQCKRGRDAAHGSSGGKCVRNVIIAAPVGGAFGEGELVHIVTIQLCGPAFRRPHRFRRRCPQVAASAVKFDLFILRFAVQEGITAINGRPNRRAK